MRTPLHRFNNDMVFVDGELLKSAGWEGELDAHSFYVDYEAGQVYIGVDPTNRLVEITAFDSALVRTSGPCHGKTSDKKGPVIRGLTFTQYAYRAIDIEGKKPATLVSEEPTDEPVGPADPATYGKEVVGTTLENVTISFCSRVAGYFRGDGLIIRNSLISDTSTEGIYVIGSSDVLLERNIFRRNNVEQLTGYYPAAVKIFNQSHRVTCRDNLVIDQPDSNGIWYDVGNVDGVFVNNWVEGAIDGFFFEISKGAIVAGQRVRALRQGRPRRSTARTCASTTTRSSTPSASFERNERSAVGDHFGWHPAHRPRRRRARGPRLRGQPAGGERVLPQAPAAVRAAEGAVRAAHAAAGRRSSTATSTCARRGARAAARRVEPGGERDLPGRARLARGAAEAAAGVRGRAAGRSPTTRARSSGAPSCAATSSPGPAGTAAVDDLPADVRRLLGWREGEPLAPGAYPLRGEAKPAKAAAGGRRARGAALKQAPAPRGSPRDAIE